MGALPDRRRECAESRDETPRSGCERLELVCGMDVPCGRTWVARAASSGDLVMPSMKWMKRSPYGSGAMGEMSFLSCERPSVSLSVTVLVSKKGERTP